MSRVPKRCNPRIEDISLAVFQQTELKRAKRNITNLKGEVVSSEDIQISLQKPIPHQEFENDGLDFRLFSVENQMKAGRDLFTLPVGACRLDIGDFGTKSDISSQIDAIDFDKIFGESLNTNVPSLNVENNE